MGEEEERVPISKDIITRVPEGTTAGRLSRNHQSLYTMPRRLILIAKVKISEQDTHISKPDENTVSPCQ